MKKNVKKRIEEFGRELVAVYDLHNFLIVAEDGHKVHFTHVHNKGCEKEVVVVNKLRKKLDGYLKKMNWNGKTKKMMF